MVERGMLGGGQQGSSEEGGGLVPGGGAGWPRSNLPQADGGKDRAEDPFSNPLWPGRIFNFSLGSAIRRGSFAAVPKCPGRGRGGREHPGGA
jgi:hypothetical protein